MSGSPQEVVTLLEATEPAVREEAWGRFVNRFSPSLLHAVRSLTREHDRVMDCYAHLLEQLRADDARRLRRYSEDPRSSFDTWLVVVARRVVLDLRGGRAVHRAHEEDEIVAVIGSALSRRKGSRRSGFVAISGSRTLDGDRPLEFEVMRQEHRSHAALALAGRRCGRGPSGHLSKRPRRPEPEPCISPLTGRRPNWRRSRRVQIEMEASNEQFRRSDPAVGPPPSSTTRYGSSVHFTSGLVGSNVPSGFGL